MDPLISVVMAVYNEKPQHLVEAIESMLQQTYRNFEFMIVADCPGNTPLLAILDEYQKKDSRISVIPNVSNIALAASLNKGIRASSGVYIARMDADDRARPDRLERQLAYMQAHPETDLLFSRATHLSADGQPQHVFAPAADNLLSLNRAFFQRVLFVHPTLFAKRSVFDKELYNEVFRRSQDFELRLRLIAKQHHFGILEESLLEYRLPAKTDKKTRIKKIQRSTYWTLRALYCHMAQYRNNLFYRLFSLKTLALYIIARLPHMFLKIFIK